MPGVDANIAIHRKKGISEKQKKQAIREEIDELIKVGAIRELQILEWISNVVMRSSIYWVLPEDIIRHSWKRKIRKNHFYHRVRTILLDCDALRVKERRNDLPKDGEFNLLGSNRQKHGNLCRRHVGEEQETGGAFEKSRTNSHETEGESAAHQSRKVFFRSNIEKVLRVHDK
ncbi:hypothetical protein LIER_08136 [Lithospermum erythrorhizon]|uniref:Uncharacterized protein n=1 Tax=Lithospermum erythrorhizon TaxID=34254 RepID=A0AAV3PB16_LITER